MTEASQRLSKTGDKALQGRIASSVVLAQGWEGYVERLDLLGEGMYGSISTKEILREVALLQLRLILLLGRCSSRRRRLQPSMIRSFSSGRVGRVGASEVGSRVSSPVHRETSSFTSRGSCNRLSGSCRNCGLSDTISSASLHCRGSTENVLRLLQREMSSFFSS